MRGKRSAGFSLIETLVSVAVTLGVGGALFQLFVQNERVFRDQQLMLEMHQSVRAVASMIAGEVRAAGQGVPGFAASHENDGLSESVQAFLAGTSPEELKMRVQLSEPDSVLGQPGFFEAGQTIGVRIQGSGALVPGDHVFFWGPTGLTWTWVRARVDAFAAPSDLQVTPVAVGLEGGGFTRPPRVSLEDAVSYRLSGSSVLRGELLELAADGTSRFRESSIGEYFTALDFVYYDRSGAAVGPASPAGRSAIHRVGFLLEAETSGPLADGRPRTYALTTTVGSRNPEAW